MVNLKCTYNVVSLTRNFLLRSLGLIVEKPIYTMRFIQLISCSCPRRAADRLRSHRNSHHETVAVTDICRQCGNKDEDSSSTRRDTTGQISFSKAGAHSSCCCWWRLFHGDPSSIHWFRTTNEEETPTTSPWYYYSPTPSSSIYNNNIK